MLELSPGMMLGFGTVLLSLGVAWALYRARARSDRRKAFVETPGRAPDPAKPESTVERGP